MKEVLCDTSYFVALINSKDALHELALALSDELENTQLITPREVTIECLNFFASFDPSLRAAACDVLRDFETRQNTLVIESSRVSYLEALELYQARGDKTYSLTDCLSMDLARARQISDILTCDEHFRQEGFNALMLTKTSQRR